MKLILLAFSLLVAGRLCAQFEVGHVSATYIDPTRSDRSIACEVYYPSTAAGDAVPVAEGTFPFIAFGHGFVMDYTAYQNITDALVASGYVMIYVETEGGFAPAHADFGLDLAYVADHFFEENATAGSLFQSHLIDRCAIMGHSMGGGATWLAANTSESVDCIAGLAPAETNPSAIAAASNVNLPALVLSGSSDAVTPPADHHIPIYEGTASECKIFVDILNGSHCGYADSGSLCDFGEFGFNGLSRAEQQVITHDLLLAFFDFHLKDLSSGNTTLQNYDGTQINTAIQIDCVVSIDEASEQHVIQLYPNPCEDVLVLELNGNVPMQYTITDLSGSTVAMGRVQANSQRFEVNTANLAAGMYVLQLNSKSAVRFAKR
jgi:dienelactone hydrolase